MIDFSELRVPEGGTFNAGKWNALVDHVGEYPRNLDAQRLELSHPDTDSKLTIRTEAEFGLLESDGGKPLAINMNKNKVGIGISAPEASLHILNEAQNANGDTLILGPTGKNSNLRLGYHANYSWIQSHGSRPLVINALGLTSSNRVGFGTDSPQAPVEIKGKGGSNIDFLVNGRMQSNHNHGGLWIGQQQQFVGGFYDKSTKKFGIGFYTPAGWRLCVLSRNVGIGLTNPQASLHLGANEKFRIGPWEIRQSGGGTGNTSYLHIDRWSGSKHQPDRFRIDWSGNIKARNLYSPSDRRIKEDIKPFEAGLEIVEQMNPVSFKYNGLYNSAKGLKDIGFIAQDLEKLAPYLVSRTKERASSNRDKEVELLNVFPNRVTYLLVNAVKELSQKLRLLEEQLQFANLAKSPSVPAESVGQLKQ